MVQVHYDEGVAIRIGPEPCVRGREGTDEASAGERTGQPLSPVSELIPGADGVQRPEGHTTVRVSASTRPTRRGRRPWHVWTPLARNREISCPASGRKAVWSASGRRGAV